MASYLILSGQAAADALNGRIESAFGYTEKVKADGKTQRAIEGIPHPDAPADKRMLVILKEFQAHGPLRREDPSVSVLTGGEKTARITEPEAKSEGFLPNMDEGRT